MEYNTKLEAEAIKLGFKKKWLDDKSGYWLEKKSIDRDFKIRFTIESDHNSFSLEVMVFEPNIKKLQDGQYEAVKLFKCDIKTIKEVLKRYK